MNGRPVQPAWRYAIAGTAAAAIGLGGMVWLDGTGDGSGGHARSAAQAAGAAAPPREPSGVIDQRPAESALAMPPAEAAMRTPPSPAEVHQIFAAAVRKAQEEPKAPAPPGIARAKTFEEAFEAMRAAEPAPVSPTAGAAVLNPFGAPR